MISNHRNRRFNANFKDALAKRSLVGKQGGKNLTAEVRENERWEPISIEDALLLDGLTVTVIRCPECHGPVRAQKGGIRGAKFTHVKQHDGCPRSHDFKGTFRWHPNDLA